MFSEEKRVVDLDNEVVIFEAGYTRHTANRVWFCRVSKRGLCVEDYANTKRAALRLARRAWKKSQSKLDQDTYGYPRVVKDPA